MSLRLEIRAALESACTAGGSRHRSISVARRLTLAVIRELPEDAALADIRDALENLDRIGDDEDE